MHPTTFWGDPAPGEPPFGWAGGQGFTPPVLRVCVGGLEAETAWDMV